MVKNPPANARDVRDSGSIPGSGRSPGGGNGNPLQYSCLENPMNRGAWQATVQRIAKSQTQLKQLSTQTHNTKDFEIFVSYRPSLKFSQFFCGYRNFTVEYPLHI